MKQNEIDKSITQAGTAFKTNATVHLNHDEQSVYIQMEPNILKRIKKFYPGSKVTLTQIPPILVPKLKPHLPGRKRKPLKGELVWETVLAGNINQPVQFTSEDRRRITNIESLLSELLAKIDTLLHQK